MFSFALGVIPLQWPSNDSLKIDEISGFMQQVVKERDWLSVASLEPCTRLTKDLPEHPTFLLALDLLRRSGYSEYADAVLSCVSQDPGIWISEGLDLQGVHALFDEVSGKLYLSKASLSTPSCLGIGPPGPAYDACALMSLSGCILHECAHKFKNADETKAFSEEEAFYRTLGRQRLPKEENEGLRRAMYLFYNARANEIHLPVPAEFSEAAFRF